MTWHRQFWEEPQAQAEFDYWAKVPTWSLEEIVALSLSKDPRFVSSEKFVQNTRGTEFSAAYFERLEIVQRYQVAGELDDRTRATKVIEWAEEYDFALPRELVERVLDLEVRRVKKREMPKQRLTAPTPEKLAHSKTAIQMDEPQTEKRSVEPREATSDNKLVASEDPEEIEHTPQAKRQLANLRALLAAMAISKYNYDPSAGKSGVPETLSNLLDKKEVQLSAQTIRNHLKAGRELLSRSGALKK